MQKWQVPRQKEPALKHSVLKQAGPECSSVHGKQEPGGGDASQWAVVSTTASPQSSGGSGAVLGQRPALTDSDTPALEPCQR